MADLLKHFDVGKHVKVIGGHYSGETGTVVKVTEGVSGANKQEAVVILDQTSEEIDVFTNDL